MNGPLNVKRGITVSSGMNVVPSQNVPFQRLKVATLSLNLTCSGFVTHSGEVLTTAKSDKKKPDGFFFQKTARK